MEFYTVNEVAKILKVCTKTVVLMIRKGKLRAVEVGGSQRISYRVEKNELERLLAENWDKNRESQINEY